MYRKKNSPRVFRENKNMKERKWSDDSVISTSVKQYRRDGKLQRRGVLVRCVIIGESMNAEIQSI